MTFQRFIRNALVLSFVAVLAGCSGGGGRLGQIFSRTPSENAGTPRERADAGQRQSTFTDLFTNADDPNTTVEVNRYIWNASLEVLDFLPVESVDPFSGVIVTGFGTPPGGGRAYRATVYVTDPALDARSLNLALVTRNGPASRETVRAVEDAILTRARQLRVRDRGL
jgi:hypothetical protein